MEMHWDHMDASESVFFNEQVKKIRDKTYDIRYERIRFREAMSSEIIPDAVDTVEYHQYDMVGTARWIASYADDLPRIDVFGRAFTTKLSDFGMSYGWSLAEITKANYVGVDLDSKRAAGVRRKSEEFHEAVFKLGDADLNLLGFFNNANVSAYVIPNGAGGSPLWTQKTSDEILADMNGVSDTPELSTNEVEKATRLYMPLAHYQLISKRRMGDGSDTTILKFFLANHPTVTEVRPWPALATAGAGSTARMIAYDPSPDKVLYYEKSFKQHNVLQKNLSWEVPCTSGSGGVVWFYPMSACYADTF